MQKYEQLTLTNYLSAIISLHAYQKIFCFIFFCHKKKKRAHSLETDP